MFLLSFLSCVHALRNVYVDLNEQRIAETICHLSNTKRRENDQSMLYVDKTLQKTANDYANILRKENFFSHEYRKSDFEKTPLDRVLIRGGKNTTTAENLAKISILELPTRKYKLEVINHKKSLYRYQDSVESIPHLSNKSAAAAVVRSWMNSENHKKNLLYPKMTHIGCGVTISYPPRNVPMLIAVQVLQSQ